MDQILGRSKNCFSFGCDGVATEKYLNLGIFRFFLIWAMVCCSTSQAQETPTVDESPSRVSPDQDKAKASGPSRPAPAEALTVAAIDKLMVQFDTEILKERGISPMVGEYFRRGARFSPGNQLVTFIVNGNDVGRKNVQFSSVGNLCFTPLLVKSLGLKTIEQLAQEHPGAVSDSSCPDYRDHSPRTLIVLRPGESIIDLTVPPDDLVPVPRAFRTEIGGMGALFNYRGYTYESRFNGFEGVGGAKSTYTYADTELGFNANDWIVRSRQFYTSSSEGESRLRWQAAYAQKTFADEKQVLQVGRIVNNNALYAGVPIVGAQWFPERGLRQLQSYPIRGVAATRARVEVRQGGVLLYSTVVPSGAFTLTDYPLNNKSIDLQVLVIEETGSQQVITGPSSSLLRASDNTQNEGFSLAAGQLWDQTNVRTYERVPVVSGAYGWALGPLSGTLGGILAKEYVSAGAAANWRLAPNASVFTQFIGARDTGHDLTGAQGSAALAWQPSEAVSLGLSGNLRTRDYRTVQDAASIYQRPRYGIGARSQLGTNGSWSLGRWGSVLAGVTRESYFDGDAGHVYSLGWGGNWNRIYVQVGVSRNTARTYLSDPSQPGSATVLQRPSTFAYVNVSIPLGNTANLNTYARRNNDVTRYGTTVNQRLNEVVSYQAAVERASDRPGMEATASVTVVPRYTSLTLGLSDRQNGSSRYAEIAGSVLATSMGVGFSPYPVQDTFGSVKTGNVAGIRIDTPQGPVWSGPGGVAAVPSLLVYQDSRLETDLTKVPLDVDVDNPLQVLQAGRGAVVNTDFAAVRVRRLLLTVQDAEGRPVAGGLPVLRGGDEFFSTTGAGGQTMISRMVEGDSIYIETAPDKRCLIQNIQTQPRQDGELFENGTALCK